MVGAYALLLIQLKAGAKIHAPVTMNGNPYQNVRDGFWFRTPGCRSSGTALIGGSFNRSFGSGNRYCEVVNDQKGYGFIRPDSDGKDVFAHISAVEKAGFNGLAEGAKVSYEVVGTAGKESVENYLRVG
jgi:CspA family cold shock protein